MARGKYNVYAAQCPTRQALDGIADKWTAHRWLAATLPNARLVRINPEHPEVPSELGRRAVAIADGAAETLARIHAANQ